VGGGRVDVVEGVGGAVVVVGAGEVGVEISHRGRI